ncbi:MAG: response regulator [Desulfobulbaceae bacterium]|nr:response regulator [Desulfobulbaceae bacterium]
MIFNIEMPELDGLSVLRQIRATESGFVAADKQASIIVLTVYKELFIEAFKLGCTDYLTKPFKQPHILTIINKKRGSS